MTYKLRWRLFTLWTRRQLDVELSCVAINEPLVISSLSRCYTTVQLVMYDMGRWPNMLRFGAIFRAFPFLALSIPSPFFRTLFPYLSPLPFHPSLPFPKEVNKNLSYRCQNALSVIKTHERNTDIEHTVLSVCQSGLAWQLLFSTCPPSFLPSVRLFVVSSDSNYTILW